MTPLPLSRRVMLGVACSWLALGFALLAPACAEEDIVLANLPPSSDSGSPGRPTRCVDGTECTAQQFCAYHDCGDVSGSCEARPVVCGGDPTPVCGCDGITYWNDCIRRAAGVAAATMDECSVTAHVCFKDTDPGAGGPGRCPPNTYCARLLPPQFDASPCPPDVKGTCWALPAVCPPGGGIDRWISCGPSTSCVTTCDAIRTGEPHRRADICP